MSEATGFAPCRICKAQLDLRHEWSYSRSPAWVYVCRGCLDAERVKVDASIPPLPAHVMDQIEPYIEWREGRAIAEFYLEASEGRKPG